MKNKLIAWAVAAIVIYAVIKHPHHAAAVADGLWHLLAHAGAAAASFLNAL